MSEQKLMTIEAVCEATSLGKTTIYELLRAGEIESIWIGTARRIPADALDAWIARQREKQGAVPAGAS